MVAFRISRTMIVIVQAHQVIHIVRTEDFWPLYSLTFGPWLLAHYYDPLSCHSQSFPVRLEFELLHSGSVLL